MTAEQIIAQAMSSYRKDAEESARDPLAKIGGFPTSRDKVAVCLKEGKSMRGKDALWAGERVNMCAAVFRQVRENARLVQKMAAECVPSVDCTKLVQSLDNATMRLQCMDAWARKSDDSDALPFAGNRELFWRYTEKAKELIETISKEAASRRPSLYRLLRDLGVKPSPMPLAA